MIRVLFETSLPLATLADVRARLRPEVLPAGVVGRMEMQDGSAGCQSLARGGDAGWTPCWISLEGEDIGAADLEGPLRRVREAVVSAARTGGLELYAIPATAQVGDAFRRYRDLLDVLADLG